MTGRAATAALAGLLLAPGAVLASGRVVVVGALAAPVADALRLELDPFGMQVDARENAVAPADLPLDEALRFEVLAMVARREAVTNVAEVVLSERTAVVLCLRGDERARRAVPVSSPPSESDHRAIALVLRSMLHETDVPVVREASSASAAPPQAPDRPTASPPAAESRLSAGLGWTGWTRVDGDFFFHGPTADVRLDLVTWLAVDVHGALSFESSATTDLAEVQCSVVAFGATALVPLVKRAGWRLFAGAGADLEIVSTTARRNDVATDHDAIAPLLLAVGTADVGLIGSWLLRPTLRIGYALEETRWLVRGTPTVQEGTWSVDAALELAVRFWPGTVDQDRHGWRR